MSDETIIKQCSPTLAGIKTGNIFLVDFETRESLQKELADLNQRLAGKGVLAVPVYDNKNKALIYLFRPASLKKDLEREESMALLREMGYVCSSPKDSLKQLIRNYKTTQKIPHEIGLFLSYPPEDVRGFIENKALNYKCVGTWKVYGDQEQAEKTFEKYKKCTRIYYDKWCKGRSIEQLTVVS